MLLGIWRLGALLAQRRPDCVYLGVASGHGQLIDLGFATLIRIFGARSFMHYDSYAYLRKRRRVTAMLIRIAGPSPTHIVGCEDMKERLIGLYGRSLRVVVVSNATNTTPPPRGTRARTQLKTIGFISHLSRAKGVLEFLDVADRLCSKLPNMQALLAGPIDEPSLVPVIKQRLSEAPWITYLGPVYGEAKSQFYADIDAFVFPTRYANEADPRVLNEALAHGVAIVAPRRGCIASIVGGGGGAVISEGVNFVGAADKMLREWYEDPSLFSSISVAALANSARLGADHGPRLTALIREIVSPPQPPAEHPQPSTLI